MDIVQAEGKARVVGLDAIAERCKRDLFFLNKHVLAVNPDLITERTHRDLCEITKPLLPNYDPVKEPAHVNLIERLNNGKRDEVMSDQFDPNRNKVLILMPRGTFKSSCVTIGFTLQYILNNPDARILIDSETYSKAKNFLAEIKGHLEGNTKYREIFKHIHGVYPDATKKNGSVRWTDAMVDLACRTRPMKEPSIMASGVDKSINGMHFDLIIEDDLHSEKNVTNKEQIQQVIDHRKLAQSLLDPGMPRITIGTRWDYQDAYNHVLTVQRPSYNVLIRKAIEDDGTYLFPERLNDAFLEEQKRDQGTFIYNCQYFNQVIDDDTATFKQSYMRRIDWELVKDKPINWFMAVDPSYEGEYSDYAAFVIAGMDFQQELIVRQVYRAKMNYMDIINLMFEWYTRYKPRRIALETLATQKNIQYMLNNEQKRRGVWLPIQEIKTRQNSKEDRIKSLAPYYEFGRVQHVREAANIEDLEYELLHFPKGTHDDMIDALATVLEIATPPTGRRVDRGERERKHTEAYDKPRSPVTGI